MFEKEKDPEAIKENIFHKPIDYEKLNRLSDDFKKHFTPQQELSVEHAFWLRMPNPTSKPSDASPIKTEAPKELLKVSLVNESLKKLKFHLARFDNVVKIKTTPDARTEGEWGFEHTKAVFKRIERYSISKILKDIFNSSVDKQCLEIAKKELLLENDRLLQQIMSQDVLLTVMNSMSSIGEYVNVDRKRNKSCDKCSNLEAELLKSQNADNDLLKNFFENNDLKAQLEDKDNTIFKLKDIIKSIREKSKEENVKLRLWRNRRQKNVEPYNSVAKLISNGYLRKGRKTKPKQQNRTRNGKDCERQSQIEAEKYRFPNTYDIMKTKRKLVPKSTAVSNSSRTGQGNVVVRDPCDSIDGLGPGVSPKRQCVRQSDLAPRCDQGLHLCDNIDGLGSSFSPKRQCVHQSDSAPLGDQALHLCDNIDGVGPSVSPKRQCIRQSNSAPRCDQGLQLSGVPITISVEYVVQLNPTLDKEATKCLDINFLF
ncbi:hypothetical protein Tco_0469185 [Tanacetum coccineum]